MTHKQVTKPLFKKTAYDPVEEAETKSKQELLLQMIDYKYTNPKQAIGDLVESMTSEDLDIWLYELKKELDWDNIDSDPSHAPDGSDQ